MEEGSPVWIDRRAVELETPQRPDLLTGFTSRLSVVIASACSKSVVES